MPIETDTLRSQLEQQARLLQPVATRLAGRVAHPPIAPDDWRGPASGAYAALDDRLRRRIVTAEHSVHAALVSTRAAVAQLGG